MAAGVRGGGHGGEGEHAQEGHDEAGVFVGGKAQILFAADGALVVELDLFAAQLRGEGGEGGTFGVVGGHGGGHGLHQGDALQQQGGFAQGVVETDGAFGHFLRFLQEGDAVLRGYGFEQFV